LLTLCIIGFIVWVLVLLFCFAIFSLASRADEIEYKSGTRMAEESAREVWERDTSVKAA
jgi:uncharacterized membrane protein